MMGAPGLRPGYCALNQTVLSSPAELRADGLLHYNCMNYVRTQPRVTAEGMVALLDVSLSF